MKIILILYLIFISSFMCFGQRIKPSSKPTPEQKLTIIDATTKDGKPVILKSDGTWEFSKEQSTEKTNIAQCDLTLKDAPDLRGLKLGMSKKEVQAVFGVSNEDETSPFYFTNPEIRFNGVRSYKFYSNTLKKLTGFYNIDNLTLEFFDGELHFIEAEYFRSYANFSAEQFKLKISETYQLPNSWAGNKLKCKEFEIDIKESYVTGNEISFYNLLTSEKIKIEEQKKQDKFKP